MERGTCPVCNGSKRRATPDNLRSYGMKYGWYGYSEEDDKVNCNNCGDQYMMGSPSGSVPLNKEGVPCKHEYTSVPGRWKSTTIYTCTHCGDEYMIDSGD